MSHQNKPQTLTPTTNQPNRTGPPQVHHGQVGFRLLTSRSAASGIIGHSGSIINRLRRQSSVRIHVDESLSPSSKERLVYVVGSYTLDRSFKFNGHDAVFRVSAAQDGLIRVFERTLEVDPLPENGNVKCRLLVGPTMAGAVIGEGGKRVIKLTNETGVLIHILPSNHWLPPGFDSHDEIVQITGGTLAVKKALLVVSRYLQEKAVNFVTANGASSSSVFHPSMDIEKNIKISDTTAQEVTVSDTTAQEVTVEVVFRLLCPFDAAGAVIGWKGRKVKNLEDETGASICFSPPQAGCNERIMTVSAIECRESTNSFAQDALLRAFNELTEDVRRSHVTAKFLIEPNQAELLNVGVESKLSAIEKATGSKLQILEDTCVLVGAPPDQKIIQIDGEHSSVLLALFQVSWRLRENMMGIDNPPLLPHKLFNRHRDICGTAALSNKMNRLNFQPSQFSNEYHLPIPVESSRSLGASNGSGNKSVMVTNTKVEIAVRKDVFGSVYGDGGSNLARLRVISGADVEVQEPSSENDGKVIISGTPDQTQAAQSLLQAFVMAAQ